MDSDTWAPSLWTESLGHQVVLPSTSEPESLGEKLRTRYLLLATQRIGIHSQVGKLYIIFIERWKS